VQEAPRIDNHPQYITVTTQSSHRNAR